MVAWINFAVLIFATLFCLYFYVLSVSPAALERAIGPDAYAAYWRRTGAFWPKKYLSLRRTERDYD